RSANCGMGITDIQPIRNVTIVGKGRVLLEGADNPRSTGDSAKVLGQRSYGTDAGVAAESQTGDWRNIGILLAYVEHFRIENLVLKDAHAWAISLERCAHGVIRDLEFSATESKLIAGKREVVLNQDGLDLRQGCHDIDISNISGYTGDDLIALTNIVNGAMTAGSPDYIMVSKPNNRGDGLDDIHNITIRNVRGHTAGGHHIVRFLNASGLKIHDVILDGVIDTSTGRRAKAAVKIGDANPAWGGVTPLGDTYRIFISNVISRAQHTILIAGSLTESSISNVVKYNAAGAPITYKSGRDHVRNVMLHNLLPAMPAPE
ncbi:MAG: glycosyl hydrolase family 28 protein, partial [Novipirellula sp. JB048]